jgi:spore maturation protein CgeB
MKKKIKVLLVAKPWQGGLFEYYFNAFKRHENVETKLFFTYPNSILDYFSYKVNKKNWYESLIKKINDSKHDLAFFINTFKYFDRLEGKSNILYLTDDAFIEESKLDLFKNVYISDKGYAEKFSKNNNYLGELAFAFDPYLHKSNAVNHKKKLVQLIANKDKNRNKWIRLMDEHDCFPDIYGNYFNKSSYLLSHPLKIHPPINFKKQNKIYSKYLISLNIHASVIKNGTNMKTFEACGFRVPQIINYTAGLENFFEPNKEIMVFSTIEEYVDKLNLLKKDKNIRNKLIVNSLKRAMAEHKYDDRVKMIINNFRLS